MRVDSAYIYTVRKANEYSHYQGENCRNVCNYAAIDCWCERVAEQIEKLRMGGFLAIVKMPDA